MSSSENSFSSTLLGGHDFYQSSRQMVSGENDSTLASGNDYLSHDSIRVVSRDGRSAFDRGHEYVSHNSRPSSQQSNQSLTILKARSCDRSSTLATGNDYVFDYTCTLCKRIDKNREAIGWCQNCDDYLCFECFDYHLKPNGLHDHILLDKNQMPKHRTCDICQNKQKARGYCETCDDFLCQKCFNNHLLPRPLRDHDLHDEASMPRVKRNSKIEGNIFRPSSRAITGSRCMRTQIDSIGQHPDRVTAQKRLHKATLANIDEESEWFDNANDVEPTSIHHKATQTPWQQERDVHSDRGRNVRISHVGEYQQLEARKNLAEHVCDIQVTRRDELRPVISGVALIGVDKLVVVDWHNRKINMVVLPHCAMLVQLKLPCWGIAEINSTRLAVSSPIYQRIYFVNITDTLELYVDKEVIVSGKCYGIACINSYKLVVSYCGPMKIEILSIDGHVLQTVVTADHGEHLFNWPCYIALDRTNKSIYIGDSLSNKIYRISTTGHILGMYQDRMLKPSGLAVDGQGSVYVCDYDSKLVQLTADLTEPRQLLQGSDGIYRPKSICYCKDGDVLYIGKDWANTVNGFKLKYK